LYEWADELANALACVEGALTHSNAAHIHVRAGIIVPHNQSTLCEIISDDKSSLAKSLISLNPFINIMVIIGHSRRSGPIWGILIPPPTSAFGGGVCVQSHALIPKKTASNVSKPMPYPQ